MADLNWEKENGALGNESGAPRADAAAGAGDVGAHACETEAAAADAAAGADTRVVPARAAGAEADGLATAAAPASTRGRQPVVIGALCAALALVVAACVFAFGSPSSVVESGPAAQGSSQSQQADPAEGTGEGGAAGSGDSSEAAAGGESSADAFAGGSADGGAGSADAASGGDAVVNAAAGAAAASGGSSTSGGTSGSGGSGNLGASGSSGSSGAPAPAAPTPAPAPAAITVSVYVDSSKAASAGYPSCMASTSVSLREGATAYDALCASGVSVSGSSSYVTAINGLAEKQVSAGSGWMYSVNGSTPMVPAGGYVLSSGDSVRWYYVV